jgi:hypothetical protein
MYKKLISSILVVALLNLVGCYSYSTLTEEEMQDNHFTRKDGSKLLLKDRSEIECPLGNNPKTFIVRVNEPSDFIYGRGKIFKVYPPSIDFWGDIARDMIDSSSSSYINNEAYERFWLKDSSRVTFREGEYVSITPEDGIGYWVAGIKDNNQFIGKVKFEEIDEIQVKSYHRDINGLIIVLSIAALVTLIILAIPSIKPIEWD